MDLTSFLAGILTAIAFVVSILFLKKPRDAEMHEDLKRFWVISMSNQETQIEALKEIAEAIEER
jgi:hypothetical protein